MSLFHLIFMLTALQSKVATAGSPSHQVCDSYVETFNPVVHDALHSLVQSYKNVKAMLHNVNISLPSEVYAEELKNISDPWHIENFRTIINVVDFVSGLTGFSSEYIIDVVNDINRNPEFPVYCLSLQFKELNDQFYSLETSLNEQEELLRETNIRVRKTKPDDKNQIINSNSSDDSAE